MISIHRHPDALTAAQEAARTLSKHLVQRNGKSALFLISGGSPMEILKFFPTEGFDERVTVAVSDERFSDDPDVNNWAQIIRTDWYDEIRTRSAIGIDTRVHPGDTLSMAAFRFNTKLKQWVSDHPDGMIIMSQGIGLDGHTAGMMPYPEDPETFDSLFVSTKRFVVGYDAGNKNPYPARFTVTVPFLTNVDISVLFVCGANKVKPFRDVVAEAKNIESVPGRVIHQMKRVECFTDIKSE